MLMIQKAIKYIDCDFCGAQPGESCETMTGSDEPYGEWFVHQARIDPFLDEYIKGYRAGRKIAKGKRIRKAAK